MTARLSENLTREKIERAWQFEQYATGLPTIAVDVRGGVVHLTYCAGTLQEITTDDVKRHFQLAIQRNHPNTQIEWLDARPDPQKPNQETK